MKPEWEAVINILNCLLKRDDSFARVLMHALSSEMLQLRINNRPVSEPSQMEMYNLLSC